MIAYYFRDYIQLRNFSAVDGWGYWTVEGPQRVFKKNSKYIIKYKIIIKRKYISHI